MTIATLAHGASAGVNDGSGLQYLLTDHLGSVVAIINASGTLTSQQRYLPFGQVRTDLNGPRITATDFGYTGQRNNSYINLLDYKSRWMDPLLGRFVSPDSIIPNAANPQNLNRYSYVVNRPINLNDPTGHTSCAGENWDDGPQCFIDGKPKNIRLPSWDKDFGDNVNSVDKKAAVRAYIDYLSDPGYFASLYIDPIAWTKNSEVAALNVFAQYTDLRSTADQLILNSYNPASADLLRLGQLRNITDPGSVALGSGVFLYRAVSQGEFDALMSGEPFESGPPNYASQKWFAESAANARQWGQQFSAWDGQEYQVISVELDTDVANSMLRYGLIDNIGPARVINDLDSLNGGVISIHEVPK